MVRAVVVDETVQQYADQRMLKREKAEVGVVIGRHTAGKDSVLQLVQCPTQDGEPAIRVTTTDSGSAKKSGGGASKAKAGGPSSKVEIDGEWVVEHAAQVARTLPGGIDILGLYVLCDDKAFQGAQGALTNALKSVRDEVPEAPASLLAVHIDAVSARIAAREEAGGALRPCEVKGASILPNMAAIYCQYKVDLRINLAGGKQRLHEAMADAIQWQQDNRVGPALPLVDGKVASAGKQLSDIIGSAGKPLVVQLLTPMSMPSGTLAAVGSGTLTNGTTTGSGEYDRHVAFVLVGAIDCRAFVHKRESIETAIDAIKSDIQRSLTARLDVLVEAAEMATAVAEEKAQSVASRGGDTGKSPPPRHPLLMRVGEVCVAYRPALPRRAFLTWQQGGCCYCDYVVEGEGVTEAVERMRELMGAEAVDASSFQCEEKAAVGATGGSRGPPPREGLSCNYTLLGAIAAGLFAVAYAGGYL